jgi:hypothetical protein
MMTFALALAACVDSGNSTGAVAVPNAVKGSAGIDPPKMPFIAIQPEDARLAFAANGVKARIGHEVTLDVDAALLKEHASHLADALSDALETVSRGIDRARAEQPAVTMRALVSIASLKIELDEKAREPYAFLDVPTGALVMRVPTGVTSLTTDALIATALTSNERE